MADRLTPFGKYFLLERINVGGMAEVYKAKTVGVEGFEKVVAIKRILPLVAEDEEFIRMFVDEAKITSQLTHANLAQTFDLGKIDDTFYIAMEYVPGKDLRAVFERLKRRGERMPLHLAAYVMARVCDGLDYAHRKRDPGGRDLHIVHRDVSPQNIILSYEGEVKLIDFGIAKAANKITKTQAGILKGKFGYMSPEQVRGMGLDARSDVFAAGVVLYELCTGERLFVGSSDFSVLEKVQQAKVPPPSQVEPSIPLRLERIILKALAREPADRYQQAAELAADLTRFFIEAQHRAVTREDLAAFMRNTFPDDREEGAPARRPPPQIEDTPRKEAPRVDTPRGKPPPPRTAPPPLPDPLTKGISDPDRTNVGPEPKEARPEIIVRSKLQPADAPTQPVSMDQLARAERAYAEREKRAATPAPAGKVSGPPRRPPPPENPPAIEKAPEPVPARLDQQETQLRRAPQPPPPRARWMRRSQYAIIALALAVAAWAVLSTPRGGKRESLAPVGSLAVTVEPADAQLLLDGTLVKDEADAQWSTPRLAAGAEHVLTARRIGYAEKSVPLTLKPGEQLQLTVTLQASLNEIAVLSSPPGAQVFLDGVRKGVTPAWLPDVDSRADHAVSVEKKCYRSWQIALPANAGRRQLAATLQPAPGACPGRRLEVAGMPAPEGLSDESAAAATLGFLNLASRPAAQVLIDGVDIGQTTPLIAWPLKSGPHRIKVMAPGGSKEVALAIRAGETHAEHFDLGGPPAKKNRRR